MKNSTEARSFFEALGKCGDEQSVIKVATLRFTEFGARAVMLYDFRSATPFYSSYPKETSKIYRAEIGVARDLTLKMAIRSGRPVSYRSCSYAQEDVSAYARMWSDASDFGVVDALGVFAAPRFNSYLYLTLGLGHASDRMAPGEIAMVHHEARQFLHRLDAVRAEGPKTKLTPRETDVLLLIAAGRTDKQIAWELDIAPSTVRTLAERCFIKLGASSRIEAAIAATRLGLLPDFADRNR